MKILVLSQTQCKPCKELKNYMNAEEIPFEEINIDNNREAIEEYDISSTPVTILMDEEEEVARFNGFDPDVVDEFADYVE